MSERRWLCVAMFVAAAAVIGCAFYAQQWVMLPLVVLAVTLRAIERWDMEHGLMKNTLHTEYD